MSIRHSTRMNQLLHRGILYCFSFLMIMGVEVTRAQQEKPIIDGEQQHAKAKVKEMPEDPARHYNLGLAYHKEKKYTDAITAFQEAIRLKEEYKESYFMMGLAQQEVGKDSAAIKSLKKAVELDPNYAMAHAALGNSYRRNGQHSAAAREYSVALKLKPTNADWHYNLGIVYQMQKNYERALTAYQAYLKHTPNKNSRRAMDTKELIQKLEDWLKGD